MGLFIGKRVAVIVDSRSHSVGADRYVLIFLKFLQRFFNPLHHLDTVNLTAINSGAPAPRACLLNQYHPLP